MFAVCWNLCVSCNMSFERCFSCCGCTHWKIPFIVFYVSRVGGRDNVLTAWRFLTLPPIPPPGVKGWALVALSKDVSLNPHSSKRKKGAFFFSIIHSRASSVMSCVVKWYFSEILVVTCIYLHICIYVSCVIYVYSYDLYSVRVIW